MAENDSTYRRIFREVGNSGLHAFGGRVTEESLPELKGRRKFRVYERMRRDDGVIAGILSAIDLSMRSVKWGTRAYEDKKEGSSDQDKMAEEHLYQCMHDMEHTWEDFISEQLLMLVYGWSWFEIVYKLRKGLDKSVSSRYNDGRVGLRKLASRSQETLDQWDIDNKGTVKGWWQYAPFMGTSPPVYISAKKGIHFRTKSEKNNPEGVSILRTSYRNWHFKSTLENLLAVALEKGGTGTPVLYMPESATGAGADQSSLEIARTILNGFKMNTNAGVVVPHGWTFEILNGAGTGTLPAYESAIQRHTMEMAFSTLSQFLLLGMGSGGGSGSYAQSVGGQEFFQMALKGWVTNIEETLNKMLVPKLFALNPELASDLGKLPRVVAGPIGVQNITAISNFVMRMVQAGAIGINDKGRDWFHDMLGISRLTEKEHEELDEVLKMQIAEENTTLTPVGGGRPGNPKTNQNSMQRPSQQNQRQGTERGAM